MKVKSYNIFSASTYVTCYWFHCTFPQCSASAHCKPTLYYLSTMTRQMKDSHIPPPTTSLSMDPSTSAKLELDTHTVMWRHKHKCKTLNKVGNIINKSLYLFIIINCLQFWNHKCIVFLLSVSANQKELLSNPNWKQAMWRWNDSISLNSNLGVTMLGPKIEVVGCGWIFTTKQILVVLDMYH